MIRRIAFASIVLVALSGCQLPGGSSGGGDDASARAVLDSRAAIEKLTDIARDIRDHKPVDPAVFGDVAETTARAALSTAEAADEIKRQREEGVPWWEIIAGVFGSVLLGTTGANGIKGMIRGFVARKE